jgi:hypothetical protein
MSQVTTTVDRGTGRITLGAIAIALAALALFQGASFASEPRHLCGGVEEDSQRCSKESEQNGIPGGWRSVSYLEAM